MALKSFNVAKGLSVGSITTDVIDSSANITAAGLSANGTVSFTGANISLGNVANLHITGGNVGEVLTTDGTGTLSWSATAATYGNAEVATYLASGNLSTDIWANGGNIVGSGNIDFTGANVSLGNVANLHITGGSNAQFLQTNGTGTLQWADVDTSQISNGTTFVSIPTSGGNVVANVGGALVSTLSSTGLTLVGEIAANTANITNSVTVGNALTVTTGGANITGALEVTGTSNVSGAGTFGGLLSVTTGGADITGNVELRGHANIANTLTVAEHFEVTSGGANITGTVTITGLANISSTLTAGDKLTVSANGADITGNVLATGHGNITESLTVGNAVIVTAGGANITGNSLVTGTFDVVGDATVTGNLTVTGDLTYLNTVDMVVQDPLILLGNSNPADSLDLGIVGMYNNGSANLYSGLARDASDGVWKLFTTATVPTTTADFTTFASFKAENINANVDVIAAGNVSATKTVTGGNIVTAGTVSIGDAKTGANTVTTTGVSAALLSQVAAVKGTAVEFVVKGVDAVGTKITTAKLLAVTDATTADYTVYSLIEMGATAGSLTIAYANSAIELSVTASSTNSTVWTTQWNKV